MTKPVALARLVRLPNCLTAVADVLAGAALAGASLLDARILLAALGSGLLYAGGIALNDRLDIEKDRERHPDRVLPSGLLSLRTADLTFALTFLVAIVAAGLIGSTTHLIITIALALAIVIYDVLPEGKRLFSVTSMGACRALNLTRGLTLGAAIPAADSVLWLAPIGHFWLVTFITVVSTFEGGPRHQPGERPARLLLPLSYFLPILIAISHGWLTILAASALAIGLTLHVTHFFRSSAPPIALVKRAVFTLIILDAAWILASGHPLAALATAALLPLSTLIARQINQTGS